MQVVRIVNPEIVRVKEFVDFMQEVVKGKMFMGGDFEWAAMDFYMMVQNPRIGTFVGEEDGEFKAFSCVALPQDRITPFPMILHAYNKGSKTLGKAMWDKGVEFLKEAGYNDVVAHNGAGVPDKAWLRIVGRYAGSVTPIGTAAVVSL